MLAIDANIFLELLLKQERYEECREFLAEVRDGRVEAIVSEFTVCGIALILERYTKDWRVIRRFFLSLTKYGGLSIYQPTLYDKIEATSLMSAHGLDFEDAVTLQSALSAKCSAIVSFDKDFNAVGLKRLDPKQAADS